MQDRVFQPVSGPLYDAENNMKTAPQLRLRNEWEGRTQTRSKRNNALPLSTKSLRVSAAHSGLVAGSSPAEPTTFLLQIFPQIFIRQFK